LQHHQSALDDGYRGQGHCNRKHSLLFLIRIIICKVNKLIYTGSSRALFKKWRRSKLSIRNKQNHRASPSCEIYKLYSNMLKLLCIAYFADCQCSGSCYVLVEIRRWRQSCRLQRDNATPFSGRIGLWRSRPATDCGRSRCKRTGSR
jgi:hypothetical protein